MADSVKLDLAKRHEVKLAKKKMDMTNLRWYTQSFTSESTLKRFLQGVPINKTSFSLILGAVGIENWQDYVGGEDLDSTRVSLPSSEDFPETDLKTALVSGLSDSHESKVSTITVSVTLGENNRPKAEALLDHLSGFLTDPCLTDCGQVIIVTGDFSKDSEQRIKGVLKHLERFVAQPEVTIV